MRVVSLLPSATEIVYALGLEPVGTSHECDYPPRARDVPAVNRSNVDPNATSAQINEQVARAERHGGVYEIRLDTLAGLDPDLIVTQGVCDVCAVDAVLVRDAVDEIGLDCEVLTTDPHSIGDVLDDIRRIGRATGREDRAREVIDGLQSRIEGVRERLQDHRGRTAGAHDRPRVAVLDWMDPVMVAGHWVPELVEWAGGAYGLEEHGARSRPREWDEIRSYDPAVLVAAPCGFGLDRTLENRGELTDRPGWTDLTAVREGRAYAMDGHNYLNRPGPRLVDTLEYLAGLCHPELFDEPPDDAVQPLTSDIG